MLERTVRKSIVEVEQNHAAVLDLRDPYLQLPSCTRIVREHITEDGVRRSSKPPLVVRHCHHPGSALVQRERSSPRAAADAWSWSRSKRRRADGLRPQIPQCSPPFSATYCSSTSSRAAVCFGRRFAGRGL